MKNKEIKLSKTAFIDAVNAIKADDNTLNRIGEILDIDFYRDSACHEALWRILTETMCCTDDELSLWLYELSTPGGFSWYKDGREITLDLRNPAVLYGYLVSRLDPNWPDCDPWPEGYFKEDDKIDQSSMSGGFDGGDGYGCDDCEDEIPE